MSKYTFDDYVKDAVRTESARQPLNVATIQLGLSGRLLHSIIGIATEVNEFNYAEDRVNQLEELGDLLWYLAIAKDEFKDFDTGALLDNVVVQGKLEQTVKILNVEAAELLDHTKKVMFYGKPLDRVLVASRLTKLSNCLIDLIAELGGNIEDILTTNINKLKARYPEKFTLQEAENRNLDNERTILEQGLDK